MNEIFNNNTNCSGYPCSHKPEDAWYDFFNVSKIFVGGLSWDTTQEKLNSYFSQFGDVVDCILMMDTATKRSRGFGFVTYKDPSSVVSVLESGPHILDKKSIDPKAAVPRFPNSSNTKQTVHSNSPLPPRKCNKIFVGGIGQALEEDLRAYFETFGTVTDVTIMMDKNTGRPRGFAFVGFEQPESSEKTALIRYHTIKGKRVEVKVAQPRDAKGSDGNGSSHSSICPDESFKNDNDIFPDIDERISMINNEIAQNGDSDSLDCIINSRINENLIPPPTKDRVIQLLNELWR